MTGRDYLKSRAGHAAVLAIAFTMLFAGIFSMAALAVHADSSVRLGQATNGEGGKLKGCKAGDQSGSEVSTAGWSYSGKSSSPQHWVYVFRPKDPAKAKIMAQKMKEAAANNHIGYDQQTPDRYSFFEQAKANNWDVSSITANCETTCGAAIAVCANAAGISVSRGLYSGTMYKGLMGTGEFEVFTSSDYTASTAKLLPGDVLCNPKAHTAMVIESPNPFLFDVDYQDTKGKQKTVKIEENSSVQLNYNNGDDVKSVTVDDKVDLARYQPAKKDHEFKGWVRVDDTTFSAMYDPGRAAIRTNNSAVKTKADK